MGADQGARQGAGRARKKDRTLITVLVSAGAAGLLVVGVLVGVLLDALRPSDASDPVIPAEDGGAQPADVDAEFAAVHQDVDPGTTFEFPIDHELAPEDARSVVDVYLDPLLTVVAPDAQVRAEDGVVQVRPTAAGLTAVAPDDEVVQLSPDGGWGFADTYYLAELTDPATGEELTEPRVTVFTVGGLVGTTAVQVEVDETGVGHLSWTPVPGATTYYVVSLDARWGEGSGLPDIIGQTEATTWTTIEQDENLQAALADPEGDVLTQNRAFTTFQRSQDELQDLEVVDDEGEVTPKMFGVMAVLADGVTPLARVPDPELPSRLPHSLAYNALDEADGGTVETAQDLPARLPVTMADGTTTMRVALYDADAVVAHETPGLFRVRGVAEGSMFGVDVTIRADDLAAAQEQVRARASEVLAERPKVGVDDTFVYAATPPSLEDPEISTTAPEVSYQVNGTDPLTRYLAANLIAGAELISLDGYVTADGALTSETGVRLWDALGEALEQNAYALGRPEVGYLSEHNVLTVTYVNYPDPQERRAVQEKIAAEAERVVTEVLTPQMSDEEKVRAINTHLTATAEYDHASLDAVDRGLARVSDVPDAWSAYGVLVEGTGVCSSYAYAFAALADAAGLESVRVTGDVTGTGERHAWNKVRIGDTWRMVDSTWNDSPDPDRYLLLTDAEAQETRTEDLSWIIDTRIGDYAAS